MDREREKRNRSRNRIEGIRPERYRFGSVSLRLRYGAIKSTGKEEVRRREGINGRGSRSVRVTRGRRRTKRGGSEKRGLRRPSRTRVENRGTERVKGALRRGRLGSRRRSKGYRKEVGINAFEYPRLMRIATRGLIRMVSGNDRVVRYLGLELQSLCLYVLAGFRRGSAYSTEAGLKYFIVGALASGRRLFGATRRYGYTGTVNRRGMEERRQGSDSKSNRIGEVGRIVGTSMVRGGLRFKLAAVPRHRWAPDVYEGAPTSSARYFAVVPKRAIRVVRVRRRYGPLERGRSRSGEGRSMGRMWVSMRSIGVGARGGRVQRRRKRFRAYSGIGHVGYIRRGRLTGTVEGVQGRRIYSRLYMVMSRRVWNGRRVLERKGREIKYRTDRNGLAGKNPMRGITRGRTVRSIAGIPPRAGFGAKRYVFRAGVGSGRYRWARVGVLASVVGGYNYLRMVKLMYFDEAREKKGEGLVVKITRESARRNGMGRRVRVGRIRNPSPRLMVTHRMGLALV